MPRIPDCPSSWLALKILDLPSQDWCWSWNSNILVTWSEEMTHLETLMLGKIESGRRRDNRGWDGWMESLTQWTWVWLNSGSWWWTGWPGMLQSMGLQRFRHDWATELNCDILSPGGRSLMSLCGLLSKCLEFPLSALRNTKWTSSFNSWGS